VKKGSVKNSECITMLKNCTWNELSYAARGAYGTKESEVKMSFFAREATRRIRYYMSLTLALVDEKSNDKFARSFLGM